MTGKKLILLGLAIGVCVCFDFSTTLIVHNDFVQDIYPAYPTDPREGIWQIQPLNIAPGNNFRTKVNDKFGFNGSTFWVQFINYYQQFAIQIHVATPFRGDNSISFKQGQRYDIDYFMRCGNTQKLNQIVKGGHPCQMNVILSHRQIKPVKRGYVKQIDLTGLQKYQKVQGNIKVKGQIHLLNKQTKNYHLIKDNKVLSILQNQQSIQCIVKIFDNQTNNILCQQKLEQTVNRLSIKPIVNQKYNVKFNKYNSPFNISFQQQDSKTNKYYISMVGSMKKCTQYISVGECRGVVTRQTVQKQKQKQKIQTISQQKKDKQKTNDQL